MGLFGDKDKNAKDKLASAKAKEAAKRPDAHEHHHSDGRQNGESFAGHPMGNHGMNRPGNGMGPGFPMGGPGMNRPGSGMGNQGRPVGNPGVNRPGTAQGVGRGVTNNMKNAQKNSSGSILDALTDLFDGDDDKNMYPNNHGNGHDHYDHNHHGHDHYDHNHYGQNNYGRPGMGNNGYNYGRPNTTGTVHQGNLFGGMPSTPADRYKQQKSGSILGTIVEGAVASMVASKVNAEIKEAEQKAAAQAAEAEQEAARKAAEAEREAKEAAARADREADYSMAEGYPSFCPGCGAPTVGKRFCEYCGTKVF